jgi:hypothetical protein
MWLVEGPLVWQVSQLAVPESPLSKLLSCGLVEIMLPVAVAWSPLVGSMLPRPFLLLVWQSMQFRLTLTPGQSWSSMVISWQVLVQLPFIPSWLTSVSLLPMSVVPSMWLVSVCAVWQSLHRVITSFV